MTVTPAVEEARRRLGRVGLFGQGFATFRGIASETERTFAQTLERLGYGSLWIGESLGGKDVFVRHGLTLAGTERLVVGTGIATIWARAARTAHAASATLAEAFPGRFVLGVGVGHPGQAEAVGRPYRRLAGMRDYLADMEAPLRSIYEVPSPPAAYPRVLAAVGPRMLELAAEQADGAHPYVQPVEHTAFARKILGPDKLLVPEQPVVLTSGRAEGLERAAAVMRQIVNIEPYVAGYRRLGFTEADLTEPSSRLLDAVFAIGDESAIAARVNDQIEAGADHVLISPLADDLATTRAELERLAPALGLTPR